MTQDEQCALVLFITAVCNAASVDVCAQTICHFCLLPSAFIAELCDFFSSLEEAS